MLVGFADDAALRRPELSTQWQESIKTIRNCQYDPINPLPFFLLHGEVHFLARDARAHMLRRRVADGSNPASIAKQLKEGRPAEGDSAGRRRSSGAAGGCRQGPQLPKPKSRLADSSPAGSISGSSVGTRSPDTTVATVNQSGRAGHDDP